MVKNKGISIVVAVIITAVVVGIVVGTGAWYLTREEEVGPKKKTFDIAFMFTGPASGTWERSYSYNLLERKLENKYPEYDFETHQSYDIESADSPTLARTYVAEGSDLVVSGTIALSDMLEPIHNEIPDTPYLDRNNKTPELTNCSSYYWDTPKGYYLAGIIAGAVTETGTIGFVPGTKYAGSNVGYNAYRKGAQLINPDVEFVYSSAGSWDDPTKGYASFSACIDKGADVVAGMGDGMTAGGLRACRDRDVYGIGCYIDMNYVAPEHVITSVEQVMWPYFYNAVVDIMNDNYGKHTYEFGVAKGTVTLSPYHGLADVVPDEAKSLVEEVIDNCEAGTFEIPKITSFPE